VVALAVFGLPFLAAEEADFFVIFIAKMFVFFGMSKQLM
jgi:hypothetical protein